MLPIEQLEKDRELLRKLGLKNTGPRLKILELIQESSQQHFTADSMYKLLLEHKINVGIATVYRVLNQFEQAGILTKLNFEGNKSVFELSSNDFHSHIVCVDCGKVIEFNDDIIEDRRAELSQISGITLQPHCLSLYGTCTDGCEDEDEEEEKNN